jgi:hypothetical protein
MEMHSREVRSYASFDTSWQTDLYLAQYYSDVESDENVTLRFLTDVAPIIGPTATLLEFGCGPTVHHLFPFAIHATAIHLADYLPSNLAAIRRWINREGDAHDWSRFAAHALHCELGRPATRDEVAARERSTRERIAALFAADARAERPLRDAKAQTSYPVVLCCFCPDSITDDLEEWKRCMRNIASLVDPGGWLVLAALHASTGYRVGNARFPSASVTEHHVAGFLAEAGFGGPQTAVTVAAAPDERGFGFSSVILAIGRRSWK